MSELAVVVLVNLHEDVYLAGIWKNDIVRGLFWQRVTSTMAENSEIMESIPSWSWASCPGQVRFIGVLGPKDHMNAIVPSQKSFQTVLHDFHRKCISKEIECCINLSLLDPFGQVNGGTLKINTWTMSYKHSRP